MRPFRLCLLWVAAVACGGDTPDSTPDDTSNGQDTLVDNGDGTATSSSTDLTWEMGSSSEDLQWADAKAYCTDLTLAGGGWHLPTLSELRTLIRECEGTVTGGACGATDTCTETTCRDATCYACVEGAGPTNGCYGPSELAGECASYWSSTEVGASPGAAWFVSFNDGHVFSYSVGNHYRARCVRP